MLYVFYWQYKTRKASAFVTMPSSFTKVTNRGSYTRKNIPLPAILFYIILVLKQGLTKVLKMKYKIINSLNISERRATCVFGSMLINMIISLLRWLLKKSNKRRRKPHAYSLLIRKAVVK